MKPRSSEVIELHANSTQSSSQPAFNSSKNQSANSLLTPTSNIMAAWCQKNNCSLEQVADGFNSLYTAIKSNLDSQQISDNFIANGMSVTETVFPDYIICLEDGRKLKMLKRHLRKFGLTPEEYKRKWKLSYDYPIVAPNYAKKRSNIAKTLSTKRKKANEE